MTNRRKPAFKVSTFSRAFGFTREAFLNDDLESFERFVLDAAGRSAKVDSPDLAAAELVVGAKVGTTH